MNTNHEPIPITAEEERERIQVLTAILGALVNAQPDHKLTIPQEAVASIFGNVVLSVSHAEDGGDFVLQTIQLPSTEPNLVSLT